MIESLGEGLYAVDTDGRLTFVNSVAQRLLGWAEADLLGQEMHSTIHRRADGTPRAAAECRILTALHSGEIVNAEEVFVRQDGSRLPVSVNAAPIVVSGQVRGLVVAFRDLTERRDAEARLHAARLQAERLAALEQTKTDFLRVASHELRGPLSVLGGYLSMLEDGSLKDPTEVVSILRGKVHEMEALVDRMLEAARLEAARLDLRLERLDARDVIQEAVDTTRRLSGTVRVIGLRLPDRPVSVLGDRTHLLVMVMNLLDNALKFSPRRSEVECAVSARSGWAAIAVRDHGHGIAATELTRLFSRFGRLKTADNSNTVPGTGLGLYVARELARMHGGDVTVESRLGQGSTFTLLLPLARAQGSGKRRSMLRRINPGRDSLREQALREEQAPSTLPKPA